MINPPFASARLTIRLPKQADATRLTELLRDPGVLTFFANVPCPYRPEDAITFIDSANGHGNFPTGDAFVIEKPRDNTIVGCIGVRPVDLHDGTTASEIGCWIGRDSWGHGYAIEAVEALLPYCFNELALDRVTASVDAENTASRRVLEKVGFRATDTVDSWYPVRAGGTKSVLLVLESARWKAAQSSSPILTVVAVCVTGWRRTVFSLRNDQLTNRWRGLWEFPGGKNSRL